KQITPNGQTTVIANLGSSSNPQGIITAASGSNTVLYVADSGPSTASNSIDGSIKKIEVDTAGKATVTSFVDNKFKNPTGIAVDGSGNLYVADQGASGVYKIPVSNGNPGAPIDLTLNSATGTRPVEPQGLSLVTNPDKSLTLYTTDQNKSSNNIMKIEIPASGETKDAKVSNVTAKSSGGSENGTKGNADFNNPNGITTSKNGAIFVCDENNNRVQVITPSGNVHTFAGSERSGDSSGDDAKSSNFDSTKGIVIDNKGNLIVSDSDNGKIKKIAPKKL
ncbi:MAG: hypothetical protein HQK54_17630, partial [Oligoflexales bacterium]|nr:hypothetical protein [Oligoflexales bacterium]